MRILISMILLVSATSTGVRGQTSKRTVTYGENQTEELPRFPGGDDALQQYYTDHINYPDSAVRNNIAGKVMVTFTVNKQGKIIDPTISKSLGFGCDEEALRILRFMPDWIPAKRDGLPVDAKITTPVQFGTFSDFKSSVTLWYNKGVTEMEANNLANAINCFNITLLMRENDEDALVNRGIAKYKMNDKEGACQDWYNAYVLGDEESKETYLSYCDDTAKISQVKARVYTVVEEMPVFPGGEEALISYLTKNVQYPFEARKNNISGRVFISFIISNSGKVTEAKIIRGIGGGCEEEALRLVQNMPNWIPGKQNGKAVSVAYNLPINFNLK